MAVYERKYRGYNGPITAEWSRLAIIPRNAYRQVFRSKLFIAFLVFTLVYPLGIGCGIYIYHNFAAVFPYWPDVDPSEALAITGDKFLVHFLTPVGVFFGFLMSLILGPALISTDLRNNALALYFARPFSRLEYLAGKFFVLALMLSVITWIPGLLLFAMQSYYGGWKWLSENYYAAVGLFVGSWIWIAVLSLLSLAISAFVRWKMMARAAFFAIFVIPFGFAKAFNAMFDTRWGDLINVAEMVKIVWHGLFRVPHAADALPTAAAWFSLLSVCAICFYVLMRRLRPYQVVR